MQRLSVDVSEAYCDLALARARGNSYTPSPAMIVLVDYDNARAGLRFSSVVELADRVITALGANLGKDDRIDLRLYGGWDRDSSLTPNAQTLHAEIVSTFPNVFTVQHSELTRRIVVNAALAHALLVEPGNVLRDTHRLRPPAKRLYCEDPATRGCGAATCALASLKPFIDNRHCPEPACSVSFESVVTAHAEQKLVDTAIVVDLIEIALASEQRVAVVTSDDDIWPGIAKATQLGTTVVQMDPHGHGPFRHAVGTRPNFSSVRF